MSPLIRQCYCPFSFLYQPPRKKRDRKKRKDSTKSSNLSIADISMIHFIASTLKKQYWYKSKLSILLKKVSIPSGIKVI